MRPSSITSTRSASATASATSWVTRIAVKPWSRQTRSSSRCIAMRVSASSAPSGSSKASTRGWLTSARASATRCFWPPDSTAGHCVALVGRARPRPAPARRAPCASAGCAFAAEPDFDIRQHARPGQQPRLLEHHADVLGGAPSSPKLMRAGVDASRGRRSAAAACSCRSRCGRRWRRTGRRGRGGRCRAAPRCRRRICAGRGCVSGSAARRRLARRRTARACSTKSARWPSSASGERTKRCLHVTLSVSGRPGARRASARSSSARGAVGELAEQRVDQDARARRRRSA